MDYRNPAECLNMLQRLDLDEIDATHTSLMEMVTGLLAAPPAPNQHLEVLETARPIVATTQARLAVRYTAHPLPPDSAENATLDRVVGLWRTLSRSYAHLTRTDAHGVLEDQRALLAQRRIHYAGQALLEYFRAHRAIPAGYWAEVHECYADAERIGVAQIRVSDPLNEVWKAQSTVEAHIAILLIDLGNPYGRTERELTWICRWAQRFAPYCNLHGETEDRKPTVYSLDLATDHGLRPLGLQARTTGLYRFNSSKLAGQIQAVLTQFKQGMKPASLGLGNDCPVDDCAHLLLSLYRPWGQASAGRRFPRRGSKGTVELCGDWLAIGFHVHGKVFEQPRTYATGSKLDQDIALLTLGERAPEANDPAAAQMNRLREAERFGFVCEQWELLDQSVGGFRMQRQPSAERLEHRQLVGLRPQDGDRFLLGQVSWLMYRTDGSLEIGVHVLTGVPQRLSARPVALRSAQQRELYQPVFLLPPTPALKEPASLVLPAGWFEHNRVLEIHDGKEVSDQIRLDKLLLKGENFEQVSFEQMAPA